MSKWLDDVGPAEVAEGGLCPNCHGARLRVERARTAFWEADRLVVLEGLPTAVCPDCGEHYVDDATAMQVDLLRGSGFPARHAVCTIEVPVFAFDERARLKAR